MIYFVFQAEDGIRDRDVTGVQTCALPIYTVPCWSQWSHQTAVLFPPAFRYRSPHEDGTPGQGQNHWTRDQHQRLLLRRSSTRSEERRVGKECRSRWWADYSKKTVKLQYI